MRGKIAKKIDKLINDNEVISQPENSADSLNLHRMKKEFWKKLNWKEKSKRSQNIKLEKIEI